MKKLLIIALLIVGCDNSTESTPTHGCLDSQACNYDAIATKDDGSCISPQGCNDWCEGNSLSVQELDCIGICGGTASIDDCGLCTGGTTGLVVNYLMDCTGECGGSSVEDNCGTCDADNSNDCTADCNGVYGGTDILDNCGVCDSDISNDCVQDCAGTWGGGATINTYYYDTDGNGFGCDGSSITYCNSDGYDGDCTHDFCSASVPQGWYLHSKSDCDDCLSGYDECNVCGGNGILVGECDCVGSVDLGCGCGEAGPSGCDNVCGSTAVEDNCGVCDSDSSNDNTPLTGTCDCTGTPNGSATIDNCETCVGGTTGLTGCIQDCAGAWGGDAVILGGDCHTVEGTTVLIFNDNNLTGSIPPEIGNLTNLTNLEINNCQLTGEIPSEIGNLTNLTNLGFQNTQLTGEIPSEIGNLTNLTSFKLGSNQFTGTIPPEIGNLTNLIFLSFGSNQLTGEIPSEIGYLTNLKYLHLYNNQFTGSIPSSIGNLTKLELFQIQTNPYLTGEIPLEIGNLTNLRVLYLHRCQLIGQIPPELGNLINIDSFNITENQLTGDIPQEVCDLIESNNLNIDWILTGNENLINTCE